MKHNIKEIDRVFPYFSLGDFAVLKGSSQIQSVINLLCVRAQLPIQLGGLNTNVLYIDGGNSFRLYNIASIAQSFELDSTQVLERIFISRAFTAYQMVDLVLAKLENAIKKYDTKLVIVGNLTRLFLDKDVPKQESQQIFQHVTRFLAEFVKNHQTIIIASNHLHYEIKNNRFFKQVLQNKANVIASIRNYNHRPYFVLEKHPQFNLGKVELLSSDLNLTEFLEA